MLRCLAMFAALLSFACPGRPAKPEPPLAGDDVAMRLRVAYAEARRGAGLAELVDLATHGAKPERVLALRGLGRIGGATAVAALRRALVDPDRDVTAAAAAGLGLAASLDEDDLQVTDALVAALATSGDHPAVIEALGRAGDASAQPVLRARLLAPPRGGSATELATRAQLAEAAAIALGRHGRRKLPLSDDARDALATATTHRDAVVRYAATWALAREHLDPERLVSPRVVSVTAALAARVADDNREVRAQAVAALARRKQVPATATQLVRALDDPDWRVAVEAVRALGPIEDQRFAVASAAVRRLAGAPHPGDDHVVLEALRSLLGVTPTDAGTTGALAAIRASARCKPPRCAALATLVTTHELASLVTSNDHLVLAVVADAIKAKVDTVPARRIALRALLAHHDVRVRAAALGVLAAMWPDGDDRDHEATMKAVIAAILTTDPILSGSALDAADELYEIVGPSERAAIDATVVARARGARDVELAAALYTAIGKHAVGQGAEACKEGLGGHPVLAKAAAECLRKLGEVPPAQPDPAAMQPPFVDVTAVIGKRVTWRLSTSRGELVIELWPDVAPWAVATVVALTRRGYYDGLEFHRVVPDFVVQGGDPTESGWGGPGFVDPGRTRERAGRPRLRGGRCRYRRCRPRQWWLPVVRDARPGATPRRSLHVDRHPRERR